MARLSIEERIAQLEARKKTLKARLTKQDRANDTRRKVLLGAFLLERIGDAKATARDPQFTADLKRRLETELPGFLTRPNDRALFPEWIGQTELAISGMSDEAPISNGGSPGRSVGDRTREWPANETEAGPANDEPNSTGATISAFSGDLQR